MPPVKSFSTFFDKDGKCTWPGWSQMRNSEAKTRRFFPTVIWRYPAALEAVAVLRLTESGAASIVREVVDYYSRMVRTAQINQCYVMMTEQDGSYAGVTTVMNVERAVNGSQVNQPTRDDFNPYYWLTRDFKVDTKEDFLERKREQEFGVL